MRFATVATKLNRQEGMVWCVGGSGVRVKYEVGTPPPAPAPLPSSTLWSTFALEFKHLNFELSYIMLIWIQSSYYLSVKAVVELTVANGRRANEKHPYFYVEYFMFYKSYLVADGFYPACFEIAKIFRVYLSVCLPCIYCPFFFFSCVHTVFAWSWK